MSDEEQSHVVKVVSRIKDIDPGAWDGLANPDATRHDPFISHAFLAALEAAGCVSARTGWQPQHLVLEDASGTMRGAMPCYLKSHSQGEYIFDYGWADAFERAGGRYYPKLQCAVPFTPVPGSRLLVGDSGDGEAARHHRHILAAAGMELTRRLDASSLHITFLNEHEWRELGEAGFLQRTDKQFHWHNQGYASYEDFLATLASRKRKALRKERQEAASDGVTFVWKSAGEITEADWDTFFTFYMDTGSRKWGRPYLNRRFFSILGDVMADRCLLVLAMRDGRPIAGALNLIGGDCLYGRYWGCIEHKPSLHFEVCYHQAIDYAIAHKLARVEAGAQGDHKLARGYMPTATYSVHWIENRSFREAVARYLAREREETEEYRALLASYGPYRRGEQQ